MKLALVTETYPPEVNGVAMTLSMLVDGLKRRGHQIQIVRPRQSRSDGPTVSDGVEQFTVTGVPLPRYDGLHIGLPARGKLIRKWKKDRPGIVHIATEGPLGVTALWAAKRLGIPVSSSFHTNFHKYGQHYGYGFIAQKVLAYLRYVHNQTACTMAPSREVLDSLRESGFKNLMILSRGVNTELFTPGRRDAELRKQWGAGEDDLVVLYVGRIAQEKNIPLAVRAFEAVRKQHPTARFVLVGDGPAREKLQRKHPDFIFAGMQRGQALAAHYASADAFFFPSMSETFGNVVTEAMASGLATLAFDYAGPRQVIRSGHNGITVPFGDEDAFMDAASHLCSDMDSLRQLGRAARATAMTLSWDAVIRDFENALQDIAEDGIWSGMQGSDGMMLA